MDVKGKVLAVGLLLVVLLSTGAEGYWKRLICGTSLKTQIDNAPAGAYLLSDGSCTWNVRYTIMVRKPITLRGVKAKLVEGIGGRPLMKVFAERFYLSDFVFIGNRQSVEQSQRASLLYISQGGFRVRRGSFINSTRDGVSVYPDRSVKNPKPIVGGDIRHIIGDGNVRDVVSLSTAGDGRISTSNIKVRNVTAFDCSKKGAVEVSDGVHNIDIRDISAARCIYGISIQDHGRSGFETNTQIQISNVTVVDSLYGVLSETSTNEHSNISITGVKLVRCHNAMLLKNIQQLEVDDVQIFWARKAAETQIDVQDCSGLTVRKLTFDSGGSTDTAIRIAGSKDVTFDGLRIASRFKSLYGITFYRTSFDGLSSLRVFNMDVETTLEQRVKVV
ncbi:hypothetical protein NDN08_003318 [Rhodosorus marinus]|uniref:Right handed beta helix domain-containing protein n=1 Tax=Rhodosorus marinus TaxID=101924 RepID=A0AAV8V0F6_9RHOD|nr:hypothetical protein NDN08_003318 [Rhodosorus marinus]